MFLMFGLLIVCNQVVIHAKHGYNIFIYKPLFVYHLIEREGNCNIFINGMQEKISFCDDPIRGDFR